MITRKEAVLILLDSGSSNSFMDAPIIEGLENRIVHNRFLAVWWQMVIR